MAKDVELRKIDARIDKKAEDPRERAARRAAEIREHTGGMDQGTDEFAAPPPPDGWSYEWKVKSVMGAENHSHYSALLRNGWEPVPVSRHPEMMPEGATGAIERKGMILMERPLEISEEVRRLQLREARVQVQSKEGQLDPKGRGGIIDRADARVDPKIRKGYEPMPIPND